MVSVDVKHHVHLLQVLVYDILPPEEDAGKQGLEYCCGQLVYNTIQCNFIVSLCREICLPGSNSWLVCLAAEQSCTSAVAFRTLSMTLLRAAVETAISEVHKLLRTGGVPISITLLFWRWLTVSLRVGALGRAIHLYPPTHPPPFPSQISLTVSVDHERRRKRGKALG